ncbi:unnamed protein product [Caenorhabditis brenneri]
MLSPSKSISNSSVHGEITNPDPPPCYQEEFRDEKAIVEVCEPPLNAEFEPVERQRHFGILRYTVNNRFRKLMLIGIVNVALFILFGVILTVVLVVLNTQKTSTVTTTTSTTAKTTTTTEKSRTTTIVTTTAPSTTKMTVSLPTTTTYISTTTSSYSPGPTQSFSCSPLDSTSFVFAYSTDLDITTVNNAFAYFDADSLFPHFTTFAVLRFDTKHEEEFVYSIDFNQIVDYVKFHQPNDSLGFNDENIGSDVLKKIETFLDNTQIPVCGSKMVILVKRYPIEVDISSIVSKLQKYHSYPNIMASNTPSGGSHPETLYDLATKTNGICAFDDDALISVATNSLVAWLHPFLIYATNPEVSSSGVVQLPSFLASNENSYYLTMTIQDSEPPTTVKTALWSWSNNIDHNQTGYNNGCVLGRCFGNHVNSDYAFKVPAYVMRLQYNYSDTTVKRLQLRIYGQNNDLGNDWLPYDN